jgi:hypothetical protein
VQESSECNIQTRVKNVCWVQLLLTTTPTNSITNKQFKTSIQTSKSLIVFAFTGALQKECDYVTA